jgi:hypothetical protein
MHTPKERPRDLNKVLSCDIARMSSMTDILIRDVPDDVLAAIDAKARRVGLSRAEYIRCTLSRERDGAAPEVRVEDLVIFAETFADLADPQVMRRAWS